MEPGQKSSARLTHWLGSRSGNRCCWQPITSSHRRRGNWSRTSARILEVAVRRSGWVPPFIVRPMQRPLPNLLLVVSRIAVGLRQPAQLGTSGSGLALTDGLRTIQDQSRSLNGRPSRTSNLERALYFDGMRVFRQFTVLRNFRMAQDAIQSTSKAA